MKYVDFVPAKLQTGIWATGSSSAHDPTYVWCKSTDFSSNSAARWFSTDLEHALWHQIFQQEDRCMDKQEVWEENN